MAHLNCMNQQFSVDGQEAGSYVYNQRRACHEKYVAGPSYMLCFLKEPPDAYASLLSRYKKVTIWARVQGASGLKLLPPVPEVMPSSTAQATASA